MTANKPRRVERGKEEKGILGDRVWSDSTCGCRSIKAICLLQGERPFCLATTGSATHSKNKTGKRRRRRRQGRNFIRLFLCGAVLFGWGRSCDRGCILLGQSTWSEKKTALGQCIFLYLQGASFPLLPLAPPLCPPPPPPPPPPKQVQPPSSPLEIIASLVQAGEGEEGRNYKLRSSPTFFLGHFPSPMQFQFRLSRGRRRRRSRRRSRGSRGGGAGQKAKKIG